MKLPDIVAADICITVIAPYEEKTQERPGDASIAPHIYDSKGNLIWSGCQLFEKWNVFDFGPTTDVNGVPHLKGLDWHRQAGVVVDQSYKIVNQASSVSEDDT
jgi:hypothetical protein